jgi:hypothetical protein
VKVDTPELIKFKHLKRLLGRPSYVVVGLLEGLWIATAKNAFMGDIGRFSNAEIASIVEWEGDADELVAALVESRWLDRVEHAARLVIHDWYDNCAQYVQQKINRKMGFTPEQIKSREGKEAARHKWGFCVGIHMQETLIEKETHMQTGVESPYAGARSLPIPSHPNPSPPLASSDRVCNPSAPDPEPLSPEWKAAVAALEKAGVNCPEPACEAAKSRGTTPHEVVALAEHFMSKPKAWEPRLLFGIVRAMHADKKITWPAPSPEYVRAQEQVSRAKKIDQQLVTRSEFSKPKSDEERAAIRAALKPALENPAQQSISTLEADSHDL